MPEIKILIGMKDLEAMLGGESEAALVIKNTIVQQFTTRHLKALINNDQMRGVTTALQKELHEAVIKHVGKIEHYPSRVILDDRLKTAIRDRVREVVAAEIQEHIKVASIRQAISDAIEHANATITRKINEAVHSTFERNIQELVDKEVQRRLEVAKNLEPERKRKIVRRRLERHEPKPKSGG